MVAVADLDLDVAEGEFVTLLGPSGSGKTTVLRLIAGFEQPTAGTVALRGRDVTGVAPFDRDVHTVFQDYALFPHLSVVRNVEYPLRIAGVGRAERRERAQDALATVRLDAMADRAPTGPSGGQRQRVALARALVDRPAVLLLDEPLGALDLKLREQMQVELKQIQRASGITFVLVTHDQDEALTLADRVVVFNARPGRAGRARARGVRAAGHRVRRRLRRHLQRARAPAPVGRAGAGASGPRRSPSGRPTRRPGGPDSHDRGGRGAGLHRPDHPLRGRARRRRPAHGAAAERRRRARRPRARAAGSGCPGARSTRSGCTTPSRRRSHPEVTRRPVRVEENDMEHGPRHGRAGRRGRPAARRLRRSGGGGRERRRRAAQPAPPRPRRYQGPVGAGEGKLSVLAWPGYAEDGSTNPDVDWVTPFEQQTGCQVAVKIVATSAEAVQLFSTGEYDVVSASGDASLRLIYGDRVQPVNTALVPNYADIYADLKDKPWNSVGGTAYGIPHGRGANLLLYNTAANPRADLVGRHVGPELAGQGQDHPVRRAIYIADAAVYLMATQPDLKITNPYALDQKQFDAAVALLGQQKPLVAEYWGDYIKQSQGLASGAPWSGPGLAAHGEPGQRRRREGRHGQAQGGRDRLVGHLDGQEGHPHQLRLPVAEPHRVPAGQRPDRGVLRGGAGQPEVLRADQEHRPLHVVPRRGDRLLERRLLLDHADRAVPGRAHRHPVRGLRRLGQGLEQAAQRLTP